MSQYTFRAFEISGTADGGDEHLCQDEFDSTYEAIKACLDVNRRLDYVEVYLNGKEIVELSPYAKWKTWGEFEKQLNACVITAKKHFEIDLTAEQAAQYLLVIAIDEKCNS